MLRASRLNGGSLFVAAAVLFLVNLNSSPVGAQLGIDTQNAAGDLCECSPACEGDVGTSLGGLGCRGRMMARADCPCCKVCAQDKGAECSHPALPCDTEFGLVCSPEGICKAEYSCQGDGECPEDRFCLGGVCVDPCPILTPCHGALKGGVCVSKAHRPVCQCPNGTIANSAGDVCVPINGTAEEEDVGNTGEDEISLQEKDSLSKSSSGGLKVLNVTHNTSAIVLPSTKGGEIYYRSSGGQEWLRESVEAGQDSVVLRGLVPRTQYTLKWSGASGGSAKITIDTGDGCQVKNVSYGVAQEWSEGCQRRCSCRPDGSPDCQPRCLFVAGDIEDPTCIERPAPEDPECCVVYDCTKADSPAVPPILKEEQKPGQPKLLVTQESHNSVTLAWDDFRAKRNEGGYVIEYREADEASLSADAVGLEDKEWLRKELPTVSPISSFTVQDLKPNTIYQVRVSIYGDSDDTRLGDSTETLTVRTDPGCIYRNTSYPVGEFFVGCEEGCMCLISGDTKCFERCSLPYFRAGAFKDDPKCREQPTNRDECCVTVQCFTTQNTTFSTCSNVVCGANAKCVASDGFSLSEFDREVTLGYCRCLEGFVGDASDLQTGCVPDPSTDHKEGVCTYKNNTYSPGEVFFDDCEYRCSCTKSTEIECEPRCEFPYEAGSKAEPGCEYIPDPEDFCCKLHVCNSTSVAATNAARSPSLISDGCTENNVTYAKNEKFYKGCETQCICMGFGDVSCFPRCPPSKVVSKTPKRCETLPDPLDSCCSITVCDEETPDVMKANITEMEKEMMLMKEKMKNMTEMEKDMLMKRMSELEKEMMMKNISDMETILQHLIEKKNELLHSDISEVEKEMIRNNMTEIEMLMKAVAEMEQEIMRPDLTDTEKIILKRKLIEMQKSMEEMMANGEIDEHTRMHLLGIEHSHFHDSENHFHDSENRTHTHDDGTIHSHPDGHLPHLHGDMDNHTHTHADGTTHSHLGGHLPHTHDDMDNFTHTHEDGTTHSHPVGNLSHSHDNMDNHTHTHEDGTTHSHPGGNLPHTHDDMDNFTHTHEDGTTHSHPVGNLSHSHNDMDNHTHTHEDGTTHSHPGGHLPHSHDDMDNHTHTHEDGTTHSHPGGNLSHSHDMETAHSHTLATDNDHNHTHTHEDGTVHSHPHDHNDESLNHTHLDEEHDHVHTHDDGTTHSHPHDHMDGTHDHMHNMDEEHDHVHTHEDGTTHSHPHGHMDDTHNHVHDMDDGHNHTHTHEDGTKHSHPHDHVDGAHNHTHMNEDNEMHPREEIGEFHNQTVFSGLDKKNRAEDLGTHHLNILSVVPINATTVEMRVGVSDSVMSQLLSGKDESVKVLYSPDSLTWMEKNISIGDINIENGEEMVMYIGHLQPSTPYQFRISYREHVSSTSKARLLDGASDLDLLEAGIDIDPSVMCSRNGRYYKPSEEFYEGCTRSCICSSNLEIHCADIECPVTFGLELVDPNCLEWDVDKDYVPTPPKCCAQVTCIASAACDYMGQKFNNYDTIPRELTGCSKVCTCNYGNVTCRDLCDPIPPIPPPELNCASEDAVRITLPGETCCETWQCAAHTVGDELIPRPHIQSLDAYTAQLMFSTPSHYQDLPGELVIRYTNDSINQPDPEMWTREVIVPPGTRISNTKWEYKLHNLEPNTQYTMQLMLSVFDSDPVTSPLFTYTTMPEASTPPTTTPLARLDIDPELHASEITKTSAKVSWRIFNDYELQYIDGVQIKYTAKDKLIPKFSQLFHRDNDQMDLRGLQPGNTYTVELVFITHKNQTTQVSSIHPITFQTLPEEDVYAFDIIVTAGKVSTQTAELFYSGVPEPEEKYVNVYRAVYLREDERIDAQAFKIPKTGQEKKIFLSELKPDIEYQVWLEAFLSNGRKKKSNVITITTRAGQLPKPERSEVDPSVADNKEVDGYYPALVAVAIIAAIACVGFLGLLIILLRKQSHAKAHINSSKNNAAYDNPSYRVGDNGYEMEMNGIRGGSNGATHVEDP